MGGKKKKKKDVTSVVWYATRIIEFLGRRTQIILKNKDTRCSLVPLCNALLLGEKITLSLDIKVSESLLIYLVQSYLLSQMQLEQNLELSESNKQVLGVLPKLPGSLYFDVTFGSSCGFEQTSETALFAFLGVPLHHGWLVDPQDVELGSAISKSSYTKLSYHLGVYDELIRPSENSGSQKHGGFKDDMFYSELAFSVTGSEELGSTSCAKMSTFLLGPQLTFYGFSVLHDDLKDRQPTVLFWNEKLITVCKVQDQIYVLLNDLSLLSTETDVVWERLTEENGDGLFVDCDFVPKDSKVQSILPLTKNERKKRNRKEKRGLKGLLVPKKEGINDGPCALIAACNILLLKGRIFFEPHETVVSMEFLVNLVISLLEERYDVDVIFTSTDGFMKTPEWLLLDCLDLNLRHGWIATRYHLKVTLATIEPAFPNAETIKKFLRGPQITPIGLVSLQEDLVENDPCILYWNKHYSTVVKVHGTLLSLVTDSNYLRTGVVWQTLHEVRGDGSYLDINFKRIYMGLDAAPSRDNLNGSQEETLPSGQIVNEMSLQEFSLIPGNEFSEIKTLFSDDVSLDVVDTTKIGRVFGVDLLEDIVFSHAAGFSWDGKFDLTTIFVIDEVRAEIRAPYCAKFSEEAKLNDYLSYILRIVELFRIKGVGLPAFFPKLVSTLSNPPCRPEVCNARQLEGFQRRLNCFWDIVLTTLALRSSLARTGLFSGIHRIRRFAPHIVQCQLDAVLRNVNYKGDWTCEVAESGHSFLKKVLRYIPGWKRSWRITNDQKSLDVVEPGYSAAVFSEIMVVERGTSAVVVSVVSDTVVVVVSVVSDTVVMVMPVVSDTVVQVWFRTPATFRAKAPSAAMKSESEAMVSRSTAASSTVMGSAINCVEKRICGDDDHGKRTSSPS
ncbi:hypothetical protein ACQ4PT_030308 [Festuca glaucescens]